MNDYDLDSLRRLTRERHDQRLREADAERFARELRGTPPTRRRLPLTLGFTFGPGRGASQPRVEA